MRVVSLVCVAALIGCQQTPLRLYPAVPVDQFAVNSTGPNMRIGVKPIISKKELEDFLGLDTFSTGILSILVAIENTSAETSYIVTESAFELGRSPVAQERDRASTGPGTAVAIGSLFTPLIVFTPLVLAGIGMANDASRKDLNIERNAFQSGTLSPGKARHGFAYFKVPQDASEELILTVRLQNTNTRQIEVSQLRFKLDPRDR